MNDRQTPWVAYVEAFCCHVLHGGRVQQTGVCADDYALQQTCFQHGYRCATFIPILHCMLIPHLAHVHLHLYDDVQGIGFLPLSAAQPLPI